LQQKAKDSIGEIVVDTVAAKVGLKMVEGGVKKDRKPVILTLYSTIAVASLFAFALLGRNQMMKRNGDVLEVLVLIVIVEEMRNVDANKDVLAR